MSTSDGPDPGLDGPAPVFLVGWWRSGTTFFWNLLREDPSYTGYFEPFHPHLDVHVAQGDDVDPTHEGVDDYWREYRTVPGDRLEGTWEPWFGRSRFHLEPDAAAPDLQAYVDALVDQAPGRPVLKVVRGPFRAAWLRAAYPDATLVHVVRNPRCVWTSMVGRDAEGEEAVAGERHGLFHGLVRTANELGIREDRPLYRVLYHAWLQAYGSVEAVADVTWWYDQAVRDPEDWFRSQLVEPGWLEDPPDVPVHASSLDPGHHPPSWYLSHEAAVADPRPLEEGEDPQISFLLEENQHLESEVERLLATVDELERRYERIAEDPPFRFAVRLYRRVRELLGYPVG
jgi:hypothetical protein